MGEGVLFLPPPRLSILRELTDEREHGPSVFFTTEPLRQFLGSLTELPWDICHTLLTSVPNSASGGNMDLP